MRPYATFWCFSGCYHHDLILRIKSDQRWASCQRRTLLTCGYNELDHHTNLQHDLGILLLWWNDQSSRSRCHWGNGACIWLCVLPCADLGVPVSDQCKQGIKEVLKIRITKFTPRSLFQYSSSRLQKSKFLVFTRKIPPFKNAFSKVSKFIIGADLVYVCLLTVNQSGVKEQRTRFWIFLGRDTKLLSWVWYWRYWNLVPTAPIF